MTAPEHCRDQPQIYAFGHFMSDLLLIWNMIIKCECGQQCLRFQCFPIQIELVLSKYLPGGVANTCIAGKWTDFLWQGNQGIIFFFLMETALCRELTLHNSVTNNAVSLCICFLLIILYVRWFWKGTSGILAYFLAMELFGCSSWQKWIGTRFKGKQTMLRLWQVVRTIFGY